MTDKIALSVLATATGAAGYGWLAAANDWATLIVTIIAGIGAVGAGLYHYERWRKLRRSREEDE